MTEFRTLGGSESYAHSVNDSGFAVGYADDPQDNDRAAVHEDGTTYDLNDLIVSGLDPGAVLTEAMAINDNGWIVVNGTLNGNTRAFLLEPTPEPGTVAAGDSGRRSSGVPSQGTTVALRPPVSDKARTPETHPAPG